METTKAKLSLEIFTTLLRRISTTSDRNRILLVAVPIFLLALWSVLGLFTKPTAELQKTDATAERDVILSSTPLALAGIGDTDNQLVAASKMQNSLLTYERALGEEMSEQMAKLITGEANRLLKTAQEEAETGLIANNDRLGLDMERCVSYVDRVRCVLLRYSGDGIAMISEGMKTGDVYLASNGYIRYQAALLALYPPPVFEAEAPTVPLQNYRQGIADTIPLMPNARIATELGAEASEISPIQNLRSNNPIPLVGGN